ncbi:uncharacterized protein LOC129594009 [Paramacrobiotus metropolitanus]|uniref:uncharacterized protein LOC129594009 n=1 Tax=Paramacrobiotus metropolitanus TaxID=2943436 RepID=UPI0024458F0C|nr:uncharacterized protein LOC129594009 [Paramacrobiotus metropolitanus]
MWPKQSVPELPINSVDVLGEDGVLRYGHVVDVADNGLVIDFHCADRRRELVHFNNVFLATSRPLSGKDLAKIYAAAPPGPRMDVRWRQSPADPWVWFPAELVNLTRGVQHVTYDVAVVRWWNTVECTDVVPVQWLRRRVPSSDSSQDDVTMTGIRVPVNKWTFKKGRVQLPQRFASLTPAAAEQLVKELNCRSRKYFWNKDYQPQLVVDVQDGHLVYLEQRPSEHTVDVDVCFDECWASFNRMDMGWRPKLPQHGRMEWSAMDGPGTTDESDITILTTNVLLEIFSHRSTMIQTSLRKVCSAWNYILDLTTCVVVRLHEDDKLWLQWNDERSDHLLLTPIFKCLRASTKYIMVDCRRWRLEGDDFLKVFEMINHVAKHRDKIHLNAVFLLGLRGTLLGASTDCSKKYSGKQHPAFRLWKAGCRVAGLVSLRDFMGACRDLPCNALLFRTCKFRLELLADVIVPTGLATGRGPTLPYLNIKISRARFQRSSDYDLGCAVWDALDGGLPAARDKELQHLSRWLAAVHAGQIDKAYIRYCCSVLCGTQSMDSRPRSHWWGKKWCADGLAVLRWEKLSRIALISLIKMVQFYSPRV